MDREPQQLLGGAAVAAAAVTLCLGASAVWAVWRMTWAHERIERHVDAIEHLVAEHVRRSAS